MSLKDQLTAIREKSRERIPVEARQIMERAVDDLRTSRAIDHVAKVGDRAPDFMLSTAAGRSVRLSGLLASGPVVLSFFRGRW
jgi:hypothetical protein